jgi:hypothetical protein
MGAYSGSNWIEHSLRPKEGDNLVKLSQLGRDVADLLGELFLGIYHLPSNRLLKVEWDNNYCIEITIGWEDWSTIDFDVLTRLVFLAHHRAIRVDMDASTHNYMKLRFWQRNRSGDYYHRHPTLREAVEKFEKTVTLPEYVDTGE